MEIKKIIYQINELNKIKKSQGLSKEQNIKLNELRKKYIENFRKNMKNILENTKVINEKGEDITPKKKGIR